jgi:hypothetical protein
MSRRHKSRTAWSRPVVIATILALAIPLQGAIGWWAYKTLNDSLKTAIAEDLQTILDADVTALRVFLESQINVASVAVEEGHVREYVSALVAEAQRRPVSTDALVSAPALEALREHIDPLVQANRYIGYGVIDLTGTVVAARYDDAVGLHVTNLLSLFNTWFNSGVAGISQPYISEVPLRDRDGVVQPGASTMVVGAPVRDEEGNIIAGLAFRIDPEEQFTEILRTARYGESGETYAFNSDGLLISESRFDDELRAIGLIADDPNSKSILRVHIRDPGGNMVRGHHPTTFRGAQPLTRMAASAVQGESGVDVDGYNDYRGVPVVGAWTWLPEYGFGVATEVDAEEAYATLNALKRAFLILISALAISAFGILTSYFIIRNLRKTADRAERLGQYTLQKKIGQGGMGSVYRASHAMLRRPTAVKLLPEEASSEEAVARFEREVQATSELTHPNTIEIYDFGRTPDGIFYYAMEYLPGYTLDRLVLQHGPQPEARVIHILGQACASLAEAHDAGIIHRDVKPSNIMLCERGGVFDVVKVLDFGLVKEVGEGSDLSITAVGSVTGTPLYVAPESIKTPDDADARSDLYCLGAVGYYLLTGSHVFDGDTPLEVFSHHLTSVPDTPSSRIDRAVSGDLEQLVLTCLEKDRGKRPATAQALADALAACSDAGNWGVTEARMWWDSHPAKFEDIDARRDSSASDSGKLAPTMAVAFQDRVNTR